MKSAEKIFYQYYGNHYKVSCLIISFSSFCGKCADQKKIKPNILWITIEDTSPQFIGAYGNADARTSNIDALAKTGIRFTTFFLQVRFVQQAVNSYLGKRHTEMKISLFDQAKTNEIVIATMSTIKELNYYGCDGRHGVKVMAANWKRREKHYGTTGQNFYTQQKKIM